MEYREHLPMVVRVARTAPLPVYGIFAVFLCSLASLFMCSIPAFADPTQGLLAHWTFDEDSGAVARDSSGNGYDANLAGHATWGTGKLGSALSLDGIDGTAVLQSRLNLSTTYTYAAWVNLQQSGGTGWQPILSHDSGGYAYWFIHPGERYQVEVRAASCGHNSAFQVPPNRWAHVVTVFDGTRFLTYLNGVGPTIGATCQPPSGQLFLSYIGRSENQYSRFFKGLIDDLRVYNRALSPEDVQLLYAGAAPPQADNLTLSQENFATTLLHPAASYDANFIPSFMRGPERASTDASALQGVDSSYLVQDAKCFGGYGGFCTLDEPAVRLGEGAARIPFRASALRPGMYAVRLIGRTNVTPYRIEKPIYLHLRINDRADGTFHEYRMRVLYPGPTIEDVGRFFFVALNSSNTMQGEIFVGPGSEEELLVHRIEFYNALGADDIRRIKNQAGTFTAGERDRFREWAREIAARSPYEKDENGTAYGDYSVWRWLNNGFASLGLGGTLSREQRLSRDDILWNMLPPLNSMTAGNGTFDAGVYPDGLTKAQAEAQYGVWQLDKTGASPDYAAYDYPFTLKNTTLGLTYSFDDLINHRPFPGSYPYKDDGTGYYFPANVFSSPGTSLYLIAPHVTAKTLAYTTAFSTSHEGGGARLAEIYYSTGNANAARDAALMLVRFALQWPGLQMDAQDAGLNTANPDLTYGSFTRWNRLGKVQYNGWSGMLTDEIVTAYDRLFDFIKDNQELADAVHRYVPWVTTPDDVIALIDSHLVLGTVRDVDVGHIRQFNPILHGLVLGPSPAGDSLLDISKAEIDVYPAGSLPIKVHYGNSLNRDGTHYIGSTYYASGTPQSLVNMAAGITRYARLGGHPPYFLGDLQLFPKLRAAAGFLFDRWVAGGYDYQVGDVGGPYTPRFRNPYKEQDVRDIWQVAKDPRAAWLITHVYGRQGDSDEEWNELTAAAAGTEDPRIRMTSRVLGGFGAAILESGARQDDYRKKTALAVRTGSGIGHSHSDALDLSFYARGLQMATDFGQRNEGTLFTLPPDHTSYTHNVVEVDGKLHPWKASGDWPPGSFTGAEAWVERFVPEPGSQYMSASGKSLSHSTVQIFRRESALIDLGEPESAEEAYVFDVVRVKGGKWHTWSFHGADTSGEADGFRTNIPLTPVTPNDGSVSATYLRKHSDTSKQQGVATAKIEATWRVGRTSQTFPNLCNQDGTCLNVTTIAAEQMMYKNDYNASSPRKFTKVTLFGRSGDAVMIGNLFSQSYNMNIPNLYVQTRPEGATYADLPGQENVYPAIVEAYAGESSLTTQFLAPTPNTADALRAVAVEVSSASGQDDVLFSDGRTDTLRRIQGTDLYFEGRFGHYSTSNGAFRYAHLAGGTALRSPTVKIAAAADRYVARIQSVDYKLLRLSVSPAIPLVSSVGEEFFIYNADHKTSYHLRPTATSNEFTFDKDPLIGDLQVVSLNGSTVTTDINYTLSDIANRNKGYTATNEAHTKVWSLERTGSLSYTLTGQSVSMDDFTDTDGDGRASMLVYDFGVGDTAELTTHVSVRSRGTGRYEVRANTSVTLTLPGSGPMERQNSNGSWSAVPATTSAGHVTGDLPLAFLADGAALIRVDPTPVDPVPGPPKNLRIVDATTAGH